jgi:hypothetical protein
VGKNPPRMLLAWRDGLVQQAADTLAGARGDQRRGRRACAAVAAAAGEP